MVRRIRFSGIHHRHVTHVALGIFLFGRLSLEINQRLNSAKFAHTIKRDAKIIHMMGISFS